MQDNFQAFVEFPPWKIDKMLKSVNKIYVISVFLRTAIPHMHAKVVTRVTDHEKKNSCENLLSKRKNIVEKNVAACPAGLLNEGTRGGPSSRRQPTRSGPSSRPLAGRQAGKVGRVNRKLSRDEINLLLMSWEDLEFSLFLLFF